MVVTVVVVTAGVAGPGRRSRRGQRNVLERRTGGRARRVDDGLTHRGRERQIDGQRLRCGAEGTERRGAQRGVVVVGVGGSAVYASPAWMEARTASGSEHRGTECQATLRSASVSMIRLLSAERSLTSATGSRSPGAGRACPYQARRSRPRISLRGVRVPRSTAASSSPWASWSASTALRPVAMAQRRRGRSTASWASMVRSPSAKCTEQPMLNHSWLLKADILLSTSLLSRMTRRACAITSRPAGVSCNGRLVRWNSGAWIMVSKRLICWLTVGWVTWSA